MYSVKMLFSDAILQMPSGDFLCCGVKSEYRAAAPHSPAFILCEHADTVEISVSWCWMLAPTAAVLFHFEDHAAVTDDFHKPASMQNVSSASKTCETCHFSPRMTYVLAEEIWLLDRIKMN